MFRKSAELGGIHLHLLKVTRCGAAELLAMGGRPSLQPATVLENCWGNVQRGLQEKSWEL